MIADGEQFRCSPISFHRPIGRVGAGRYMQEYVLSIAILYRVLFVTVLRCVCSDPQSSPIHRARQKTGRPDRPAERVFCPWDNRAAVRCPEYHATPLWAVGQRGSCCGLFPDQRHSCSCISMFPVVFTGSMDGQRTKKTMMCRCPRGRRQMMGK